MSRNQKLNQLNVAFLASNGGAEGQGAESDMTIYMFSYDTLKRVFLTENGPENQ